MVYLYLLNIVLAIAAVVSCLRTPTSQMPNSFPKVVALLLIILMPLIGPIAWFVISWASRAEAQSADGRVEIPRNPLEIFRLPNSEETSKSASEPVPPDDNPDFLFSLEAQLRRQKLAKSTPDLPRRKAAGTDGKQPGQEGESSPDLGKESFGKLDGLQDSSKDSLAPGGQDGASLPEELSETGQQKQNRPDKQDRNEDEEGQLQG